MEKYTEKIRKQFTQLTKRQQVVAKYIIDFPKEVAFQTAKQVGHSCKVSETTVIRFCYILGFSGFSELQKEIQTVLLEDAGKSTNPIDQFREDSISLKDENLIHYVSEQDRAFVKATIDDIDVHQYKYVIERLIQANNRVVVGLRSSYGPANWLNFSLNIVIGNTSLYRGEIDDSNYLLSQMDERTVVIGISFARYSQETLSFIRAAKKKGAAIIVITDDRLAPIGQYADYLFRVIAPAPISIRGITPTFSLLNLLITSIAASESPKVQTRLVKYDQTSAEFNPFARNETAQ